MESVADELDRELRARVAELSPGERIELALRIERRSVEAYASLHGVTHDEARREFARRRRRGRTPSACMDALTR